jgi:hypothetical protein
MPTRSHRAVAVMATLTCLLLCCAAVPAGADLIWAMRFENPPAVVGPMDTVVIRGVLFNSPTSDQNLGVISGGSAGVPPGFDYEVGAFYFYNCAAWQVGPDGSSFSAQFQGVNLAPGQKFNFIFGSCVPPPGGNGPGLFQISGELQLFRSSPARPQVGSSNDLVRWMVSNTAPAHVAIDVRPGSDKNKINLCSSGNVAVAILSTATFDATRVDPRTLRFGPGNAQAIEGKGHFEDANHDGRADLVVHFWIQDIGLTCGDTEVTLFGETYEGMSFIGTASVTVKCCR